MQNASSCFGRIGLVVLSLLAASGLALGGGTSEQRVTARGQAAGIDLKAQDEACMDARRAAVLSACGELIGSATVVDNFELIKDQIISQANGYIVESKEVKKGADEAKGISFCEVEAVVAVGKIKDRPPLVWTSPRTILLVTEDFDGSGGLPPSVGGITQALFEGQLAKASMIPIDRSVMENVLGREILVEKIKGDTNRLCEMIKKLDCDIIIHFDLTITPMGLVHAPPPVDADIYRFSPMLTYRVIQADNAHVIDTDVISASDSLTSLNVQAPPKEVVAFVKKNAPQIVKKIASAVQKREIDYKPVTVTFDGCGADEFRILKQGILGLRGCQTVLTRQCTGDLVTTDIMWAFGADRLAQKLVELPAKGFRMETEEQTGNSLKMKVNKSD